MTDDELKHLCHLASIWCDAVLRDDFDPTDLGGESLQNARNCHQFRARAFIGLLNRNPEMKPRFRVTAIPMLKVEKV